MAESIIILTTGQPGAGKSYSRVRWLVRDFLLNNSGLYITNLPLDVDLIAQDLAPKLGKTVDEVASRIVLIPRDELDLWYNLQHEDKKSLQDMRENKQFLPSLFFDKFDLGNAHIALDEFHLYFSKNHPPLLRELWNIWFAEIRKLGCTFEAITQDMSLLPREFVGKVGRRVDLIPVATTRDPYFHILMGDWYELRAGFTGITEQRVSQTEYRKGTSFTGGVKWVVSRSERFVISSDYYKYYNSYQRNDNEKSGSVITPAQRFKKRIWIWFLRRNFWAIFSRFFIVVVFCWLTFGGGILMLIQLFISSVSAMSMANGGKQAQAVSAPSVSAVSAVPAASDFSQGRQTQMVGRPGQGVRQVSSDALPIAQGAIVSDDVSYKPAMFFDGSCWLRNGVKISIDYVFKGGVYDGKKVVEIDQVERFYRLDDGFCVRMF